MKTRAPSGLHARRSAGQTVLFVVIFISMFLAGVIGLATDYSQLWARRQMAQAAADAACQAGAADLYVNYAAGSGATSAYGLDFSWIGTAYNCSSSSYGSSPPCLYASYNGYSGSNVAVSFPSSVSGAPDISAWSITNPYIQVKVTDTFPLSFTKLLLNSSTATISAKASCGMVIVNAPIPLLVLHPSNSGSLSRNGGATIDIIGGPNKSIEVNSSSTTAVMPTSGGSGTVDLTLAGPNHTGADFGVFGSETQPASVLTGTGSWKSPALPYADPWAKVAAPSVPGTTGEATLVGFGWNGCPDPTGCVEFSAGNYVGCTSSGNFSSTVDGYVGGQRGPMCLILSSPVKFNIPTWGANTTYVKGQIVQPPNSVNPGKYGFQAQNAGTTGASGSILLWNQVFGGTQSDNGITWVNVGAFGNTIKPGTAIFDPGVYYVGSEGLQADSNSTLRPSKASGDGSGGTTFYFSAAAGSGSNHGTIYVTANSGKTAGCVAPSTSNCIASYETDGSDQTFGLFTVGSVKMICSSGAALDSRVPATVDGNILLGPCSGTYKGGTSDNTDRGFLFFQNRSLASVSAQWGGGGSFATSGFMYFHDSSGYTQTLTMQGSSGSSSLALGDIVVDQLSIGGTPTIKMILDPNVTSAVLKPSLLQ